ncbi:MAG: histidine phosphatase family protein [Sphingobacteriales bacterium]|nr:MAG: histidine phosphatase family protein [Sphingobacteriales bacterium]
MKKQLLLVRHAKSDWGNVGVKDFDRPLNTRGFANAPEMGERLNIKNILPDVIVSSPALRAITTAKLIAHKINFDTEKIVQIPQIYEASEFDLLKVINHFDNTLNFVALFGHNGGLSNFANYLTGANIYNMPTCGMVLISFDTEDWATVSGGTGEVLWYDYPKSISV